MKYTFYESFQFRSNTMHRRITTHITNVVDCYTNCSESSYQRLLKKHGGKVVTRSKGTGKVYVRLRARKASVRYNNREEFCNPELDCSFSENYTLSIKTQKGELSW